MSNVVKFPYDVSRRAFARLPRISKNGTPEQRSAGVYPAIDAGLGYPRRNSRNPLRKHLVTISAAITEANKVEGHGDDWLDCVRKGAAAARVMADELARIADEGGA